MKHILTTIAYNDGKEYRTDIELPNISTEEFEEKYLGKSWILFQSVPIKEVTSKTNFIRLWNQFHPETETDWKYFGRLETNENN